MLLLVASMPYPFSLVYNFPSPKPFSGKILHNPYADRGGRWYKSNLQGHSASWGGVTDGRSSGSDYYDAYRDMGYDIVGLSNYQKISPPFPDDSLYIPVYEHGWNVWKRHHLCVGAKSVVWLDYPLFQSLHHKQFMIDRLKPTCEVLVINHPKFMWSFQPKDFAKLTGYNCIEVLNHYRRSFKHWDAALSTGHPAWIIGNDDTHDVSRRDETGRYWTMIHSNSPNTKQILNSLSNGNAYGVSGWDGVMDNGLKSVSVSGKTLTVECDSTANEILFIGQNGIQMRSYEATKKASFTFSDADTYIRPVIVSPKTRIYLNPVFRTNGALPVYRAEINWIASVGYWLIFICGYWLIIILVLKKVRSER